MADGGSADAFGRAHISWTASFCRLWLGVTSRIAFRFEAIREIF
jgi:hypothetical protein